MMRMYWVVCVDSGGYFYVPTTKINKEDLSYEDRVVYDIYTIVDATCYVYDMEEGVESHINLTEETVKRILSITQFEEGEESKSNLKALQDLMEIFPDLIQEFGVDYRPEASIPEDYYA